MSRAELRVAVDVGSKKHHVAIAGSDGRLLDEFEVAHEKEGFARFFSRVETVRERLDLPVALGPSGSRLEVQLPLIPSTLVLR
jgi:uncharacterized protein (UPF0276 family)